MVILHMTIMKDQRPFKGDLVILRQNGGGDNIMLIRLWKDRHDKPSLLEWKAMSATCKTWKNEARHSTHPPYGTPSFSSCVWLSWTPHSKTRIFDGSKREKIHSREPWERVRQCGKPTIRLVRLPKASASQNLQDHLSLSLASSSTPHAFPRKKKGNRFPPPRTSPRSRFRSQFLRAAGTHTLPDDS